MGNWLCLCGEASFSAIEELGFFHDRLKGVQKGSLVLIAIDKFSVRGVSYPISFQDFADPRPVCLSFAVSETD